VGCFSSPTLCGRWLKALRVGAVLPANKPPANIGEEDLTDLTVENFAGVRLTSWTPAQLERKEEATSSPA